LKIKACPPHGTPGIAGIEWIGEEYRRDFVYRRPTVPRLIPLFCLLVFSPFFTARGKTIQVPEDLPRSK